MIISEAIECKTLTFKNGPNYCVNKPLFFITIVKY